MLRYASPWLPAHGAALDFGCGCGFLLEMLLDRGFQCWGADASPFAVQTVRDKFRTHPGFHGVELIEKLEELPFESSSLDLLFVLETLEHLTPAGTTDLLGEMHRILRSGGTCIITTPHNEPLDRNMAQCPQCGCRFHRTQHMQSFTPGRLAALCSACGYSLLRCGRAPLWPDIRVWLESKRPGPRRQAVCPDCSQEFVRPAPPVFHRLLHTINEFFHIIIVCRKGE